MLYPIINAQLTILAFLEVCPFHLIPLGPPLNFLLPSKAGDNIPLVSALTGNEKLGTEPCLMILAGHGPAATRVGV